MNECNYLIVGLGNPEEIYKDTRHNLGYITLDRIPGTNWKKENLGWISIDGGIVFLKPDTGMNDSGKSVKYWKEKLNIPIDKLLIISDDLSLPIGTLRLRQAGGSGGHNGLKSIEENLNTNRYSRLKLGIGNDFENGKQIEFVLQNLKEEEISMFDFDKINDIIFSFIQYGPEKTMNNFN